MLWQLCSGEISISGTDTRNVGDVRVMQIRSLHSMHVYLASASSMCLSERSQPTPTGIQLATNTRIASVTISL